MVSNVSIVIVTYNNADSIQACLSSLLKSFNGLPYVVDLTIVDNLSTDATVDIIKNYQKQIAYQFKLIENPVNLGFGSAHNMVMPEITSKYHIICNPDLFVTPNTIQLLADHMDEHPDIGIICPKLLNSDGSLQANNHRYPTLLDLALRRLAPRFLKKILKHRMDAYIMLDKDYDCVYEVPFLSGAFMFCRTDLLKKVGGFDERYFLYFEDADLCRKIQEAGYKTVYFPDAQVTHEWERAAYKSWRITWIMFISALKYFHKWGYRLY